MNASCVVRLLVTVPLLAGCVLPGHPISPFGRQATVYQKGGGSFEGELIAATPDTIWLMRNAWLTAFHAANVTKVNVYRHEFGAQRTVKWAGAVGAVTGLALTIACGRYNAMENGNNSGCGAVFPGTMLFFGATGGLFALINGYSSKHHLSARDTDRLRAYSRFPQGVPDSLARAWSARP